ncbi:helix-turn-helix domain-containing protein [Paenibacillus filicis]|uniref:Helix-turn-helix domain-containing protein n=1 Tax=Paenibacillus gyeongsangnamensis TaxID=3388067 RepID=A0ABT4Q8Q0_9BACL|nr:helix-turn-helix domain-containing protein [Paenibacillus filicis]MCZ8513208.1 helix-turn-helix domain-containing protein [Paenibacillus filicis]
MKNWFYRLLLSYLPIFLAIVSAIILISFFAVKDFSQKEAKSANRLFLSYVQQTIEQSLKDIDSTIIKGILTDKSIKLFFYPTPDLNRYVVNNQASEKIQSLIDTNPMINSIYMVRLSDHTVLSRNALMPLEEFGDREFIKRLISNPGLPQNWTLRDYHEFFDQKPSSVVTLVRKVPLLSGSDGFLVVNVGTDLIVKSFDDIYKSNIDQMSVVDKDGNLLFGTDPRAAVNKTSSSQDRRLPGIQSDYTGWEYRSGIGSNFVYSVFSIFSYIWITLILVAVCSGAAWIVFVTRRNYKPLERILGRIHHYSKNKSFELSGEKGSDEFHFIDSALDKLIEQSNEVQKQSEENLQYRRQYFFHELLLDAGTISREVWETEMKAFGLPEYAEGWSMAVIEMDKYAVFLERYPRRDQHLLKFVLSSVIKEIADQHHSVVWTEWISGHQLAALYQWPSRNDTKAAELCESIRKWVELNLDFTVSVGIGNSAPEIAEIKASFDEALEALKYKSSLGGNRVIEFQQVWEKSPNSVTTKHVQIIRSLAQSFRMGEDKWVMNMNKLFDDLSSEFLSRDDIVSLINYMMYHIFREISGFSSEIQDVWTKDALPQMGELLNKFDTLEDLKSGCRRIFSEALDKIEGQRNLRSNKELILHVKAYVEQHFSDPELSLTQLGDAFQISSKYVSQLFKEAFGEKFVDYLVKVRVDHAKIWLAETELPVQEIAAKAGYTHSFSFIRVFKKLVGMTPGDYRKEFRSQQS